MGGLTAQGYGQMRHKGKVYLAHRLAYEMLRGPIPKDKEIDHLCRERSCANPWHLEIVPRRENVLRGESPMAKHARKTHCIHGHPLTGENLYVRPDNEGRQCRACRQEAMRRFYTRRRQCPTS